MSTSAMSRKAAETIKRAGIADKRGVVVVEGFASSGAETFDDTIGDLIPGASLLVSGARRVVLVTDRNVYLFKGRRFDQPGARLGCYPIEPGVLSFDGREVSFPDGQVVRLTNFQAEVLAQAAAIDVQSSAAEEVLERAGITGERALTVERGFVPKAPKTTVGARIVDAALSDSLLDLRETHDGRIVLVTDQHVYVFEGRQFSEPGTLLGRYEVGPRLLSRSNTEVTFPDGEVVTFQLASDAKRVTDAASPDLPDEASHAPAQSEPEEAGWNERSGSLTASPAFGIDNAGAPGSIDALTLRWNEDLRLILDGEELLGEWECERVHGILPKRGEGGEALPPQEVAESERKNLIFERVFSASGLVTLTNRRLAGVLNQRRHLDRQAIPDEVRGVVAFSIPLTDIVKIELLRKRGPFQIKGKYELVAKEIGLLISTTTHGRLVIGLSYPREAWATWANGGPPVDTGAKILEAVAHAAAEAQLAEGAPERQPLLQQALASSFEPVPHSLVTRVKADDNRHNLVARLHEDWSEDTPAERRLRLTLSAGGSIPENP